MSRALEGDVLVVGLSARALAESVLRAGSRPVAVDFFGDLDLAGAAPCLSLGRDLRAPWSAARAAEAAADVRAPAVVYGADLENAPGAVARLARGRELLGNPPAVLRAVRDPARLFAELRAAGLATPETVFPGESPRPAAGRRWLRKPLGGGGGRGISWVDPVRPPGDGELLQEWLEGPVLGLSFLADGHGCQPLALASQLERREAFGAAPFAYCGTLSIIPYDADTPDVRDQAVRAAEVVTQAFGLRGWNGMDFVLRAGEVVALEVNPRHTSSMELWDDVGSRLFAAHVCACRGELPDLAEGGWLSPPPAIRGKAVLFAREDVRADAPGWTALPPGVDADWRRSAVADVPHPGERIPRGHPICSLYASAPSVGECVAELQRLATAVQRELVPASTGRGPASASARFGATSR